MATDGAGHTLSAPGLGRRLRAFRVRELTLFPIIIIAIVVGIFVSDAFLTKTNFINIFQQSSELAIVVIAETLILIAGRFDLSLESIVGLAPMVGAWLIVSNEALGGSGIGLNGYVAILVMFAVGTTVGIVNGFLVVKLALNAFIVTLAMLILLRGVTLGLTSGKTLTGLPEEVLYLGSATWFTIPVSIWVAGLLYLFSDSCSDTTHSDERSMRSVVTPKRLGQPEFALIVWSGWYSSSAASSQLSRG